MITMREIEGGGGGSGAGNFHHATGGVRVADDGSGGEPLPGPAEAAVEVVAAGASAPEILGTPEGVRRWVTAAQQFARGKVACQVMAGFELLEIRRTYGFTQGGFRGQNPRKSGFGTWEEFLRREIGISDDTARAWCRMAEAVRPRLKKLPGIGDVFREILSQPITSLREDQTRLLADAVHHISDGKTQLEFELELGIGKAPQGAAAKGGNLGGGRPAAATPSEDAARRIARDDWTAVGQKLQLAGGSFVLLDDAEVDGLIHSMETVLGAMRRWRSLPHSARTDAAVREIRDLAKL